MMRRSWSFLGVLVPCLVSGAALSVDIPVAHAAFEEVQGGRAVGWTLAGASGAGLSVGVAHVPGFRSLRVENPASGAETTVQSEPVTLQVGQAYRLSAYIRTKGVHPDPLARYPTALGACLSMKSFPFTNASATAAGEGARRVSVTFFATTARDRVQLHLGRNGATAGTAWFDEVRLEKVEDVGAVIPLETVRWAGKGFRYDDGGWIYVHVEGEPHERGVQFGQLVAPELARFLDKLAILQDKGDPARGWERQRGLAEALMLRKFDAEYLEEMKGIADGAGRAGAKFRGREVDVLDIVAMNCDIELGELAPAARVTPSALSGKAFAPGGEVEKGDRCSSFIATKSATADGRIVMGQMFMWPQGYTGVDWNLMVDVQPAKGHRFVMQTFAGGISSGTDWYLNDAGLVLGEATVAQTPFREEGTPEANRIRRAAQYAASIDQVAQILQEGNNGLYTNDWTIADTRTGEGAVFLLGTNRSRLWRTGSKGHPADTPGGLKDFLWADNNNRDPEVRRERTANSENAPVDLAYPTSNRDLAFQEMYKRYGQGGFDLAAGVALQASSPINRPHACDGKLTTSEMAEKLMFIAHYGKTTLREKWVGGRYLEDLPGATPHLTLGYTTFSPVFVADRLKAARGTQAPEPAPDPVPDLAAARDAFGFPRALLWTTTILPAAEGDAWFGSGSAAYHALLKRLPEAPARAAETLKEALGELNARYAYLAAREAPLAPARARTAYDRYGAYQFPRIKGTFLLHQLRLLLGNIAFGQIMTAVQEGFRNRPMGTEDFITVASRTAGRDLRPFILQWVDREDLPDPVVTATSAPKGGGFEITVRITQPGQPYRFVAFLEMRGARTSRMERIEMEGSEATFTYHFDEKPVRVLFNPGRDLPVRPENPFSLANQLDDFGRLLLVNGTSREVEANRSLALNYREMLADAFTETLPSLKPDAEVTEEELASRDLVVFGGPEENGLLARMVEERRLPVEFGKGFFRFQGRTYGRSDDGLALALPNPYNPQRTLTLITANSRLEFWHMTRAFQRGLPGWVVYRVGEITARGFQGEARYDLPLE